MQTARVIDPLSGVVGSPNWSFVAGGYTKPWLTVVTVSAPARPTAPQPTPQPQPTAWKPLPDAWRPPAAPASQAPSGAEAQRRLVIQQQGQARLEEARRISNAAIALKDAQEAARKSVETQKRVEIQQAGQRRLEEARRQSDIVIAQKKADKRAAAEQKAEVVRIIAAKSPPGKGAGIKEWTAYYASIGKQLPDSLRQVFERKDQAILYKEVAGNVYVTKQPGVNPRGGITWMFAAAYGGGNMPYWGAWYNRTMTADQIGYKVAADYLKEIQRRLAVQAQHRQDRETWEDAGRVTPEPARTPFLRPAQLPAPPPALPARRQAPPAPPPALPARRQAPPALPPAAGRRPPPMIAARTAAPGQPPPPLRF